MRGLELKAPTNPVWFGTTLTTCSKLKTKLNVGGTSGAELPQNSTGFSDSAPEVPPTFRKYLLPARRFELTLFENLGRFLGEVGENQIGSSPANRQQGLHQSGLPL